MILKLEDILKFAAKNLQFLSLPSQFCVCNTCSHKSSKLAQGKFAVGQRKNRENSGNFKMQFEWVPCSMHTTSRTIHAYDDTDGLLCG